MNNSEVEALLYDCKDELENIMQIIEAMGSASRFVPYLNKYSIIKACGTIEKAYKDIVSDVCIAGASPQAINFIENRFRESSSNPSLDNIRRTLKVFDSEWKTQFNSNLSGHSNHSRLVSSITSLVDLRNNLAHGGNPTSSVDDVFDYFNDSFEIIKILDDIVR